jgi:hypothetical protein
MKIQAVHRLFFPFFRTRRMRRFAATFRLTPQTRILDVGGTPYNWTTIDCQARITLLNVVFRRFLASSRLPGNVRLLLGDGRLLGCADRSFEICYSNSVIEHLSELEQQKRFADELRRVGNGVWVQTPARCFFLEPHLIALFIHYLPRRYQRRLVRNFSVWGWLTRPGPERVDAFLHEVRLLTYREMKELFPDCRIERERFLGWTKSYIAVRDARSSLAGSGPRLQ